MSQAKRTFSLIRALQMAAAFGVLATAMFLGGMWAIARDPEIDIGAMGDRVIEAKHGLPAAVVRRRDKVLETLQQGSLPPWAGEYFEGDGLGMNVRISLAPGAGVVATWNGCLGLYSAKEGDVQRRADGSLAFVFNQPNGDGSGFDPGTFATDVMPVRWGERRYLIPRDRMIEFVNAVNFGSEPREHTHGVFLLAQGDEAKPVSGLPELPEALRARIRQKPLIVGLSSVEPGVRRGGADFAFCEFRVRFEVANGELLAPGQELAVVEPPGVHEDVEVLEVAGTQALAKIRFFRNCIEMKRKPEPGWLISTGAYTPN